MVYKEYSNGVLITVEPFLVSEKSKPELGYFFYAYHVKMKNLRPDSIQLVSRHWMITDGSGHLEEVKGDGVIGLQPIMATDQEFDYTSFCPLRTPTGNMRGYYFFKDLKTRLKFKARVPLFFFRPDQRSAETVQEVVI